MPIAAARTMTRRVRDGARVPLPRRLAARARWAVGLFALLASLALLPPAPAQAQSVSVSNITETAGTGEAVVGNTTYLSNAFTTGGTSTDRYTLNSVAIAITTYALGQFEVSIHNAGTGTNASNPAPRSAATCPAPSAALAIRPTPRPL